MTIELPAEYGKEIFRSEIGSRLHGTEFNSTSDHDEMGICVEPYQYVIGLNKFEQWTHRTKAEGERSGPGDLDLTVYSLRKWMSLALAGNPTIILPLWVPESRAITRDGYFHYIQLNADRLLSKQLSHRYRGFMLSRRDQMLGIGKKTNRPELVEIFGYDTKFAYEALRVGIQGVELLTNGSLQLPMSPSDRSLLYDVRNGKYAKEFVLDVAEDLAEELTFLGEKCRLPDKPDYAWANATLKKTYMGVWGYGQVY